MFSIIVACDEKYGIGKNGTLPWHIPKDLRRFRIITNESNIIMGRKTWESLPSKPLKNRHNIILSKTLDLEESVIKNNNVSICSDLDKALEICLDEAIPIYVIGGSGVYNEAMVHPKCRDIILTRVIGDFNCDTFINKIPDDYICVYKTEIQVDSSSSDECLNGIQFRTEIWSRIKADIIDELLESKIKSNI